MTIITKMRQKSKFGTSWQRSSFFIALLQDDKEYQWKHKIPEQRYNSIQEFYISAGK